MDMESGWGYVDPGNPFSDVDKRRKFVSKVFMYVAFMLMPVFVMALIPHASEDIMEFFHRYTIVLTIVGLVGYLVSVIAISCSTCARQNAYSSLIIIILLSFSCSILVGVVTSSVRAIVPVLAVGCTALIVLLMAMIAKFGSCDITGCGMLLCILGVLLFAYGLTVAIVTIFLPIPVLHTIYSGLAIFVFTMYLWFDLQLIMGGRKYQLTTDEYILGATCLFCDIFLIFYNLLLLIGDCWD